MAFSQTSQSKLEISLIDSICI